MKKSTFLFSLSILLTLSTVAQQGTLRGTIYDGTDGQNLIGASVVQSGTSLGAYTDLDGLYSISLDPGTYSIDITYVSFAKQTITGVMIKAGEVTVLDAHLQSDIQTIGEVIITAKQSRNTESALLNMQKKSANVMDGISSQQFKKVGDGNAATAIRRIPGVSVQGGKHVYVRGLGDRYTKTILNGMAIPGLDPDRNSVQMDIFPTNTIDNIIVYKTFSPDLDADFTGGMVDVVTKDFPDQKAFSFSYTAGFNPNMTFNNKNISYEGGSLDLLGFDDGTRENPLNPNAQIPDPVLNDPLLTRVTSLFDPVIATEEKGNFLDQGFNVSYGNQKQIGKKTLGYSALLNYNLDYDFYEEVERGFWLKSTETSVEELQGRSKRKARMGVQDVLWSTLITGAIKSKRSSVTVNLFRTQGATSKSVDRVSIEQEPNVSTLLEDILMFNQRSLSNIGLIGKHNFDSFEVQWKNSFSMSSMDDPDFRVTSLSIDDVTGDTLLREGDGAKIERYWRDLDEWNNSTRVDFIKQLRYKNDQNGRLKIGLASAFKERDFTISRYNFNYRSTNSSQNISGDPDWFLIPQNLWTAETGVGTFIQENTPEPANTFNARQSILAGYVLNDLAVTKKLKAIYGVRVEKTDMHYTGSNQSGTRRFSDEKTLDELNILPSTNLVFELNDKMNLRASYNQTLARPTFREKSVAQIFDPISKMTFLGNIDMEQTSIDNVDLRWEFFPKSGEVISLSGFYKVFDGHIELAVFETAVDNVKPVNSGTSTVLGAEFEARKRLEFISDSVNKWTIGSNISIIDSKMDMSSVTIPGNTESELEIRAQNARNDETIDKHRQMAGQSPYLINAFLGFSNTKSGLEGNISYNVQGNTLTIVGIGLVPDVYTAPRHMLNMRVAKKLGKQDRSTLSFRLNNILDQDRVLNYESSGADDQVYLYFKEGMDFSIGFRYTL